MPASYPPGRPAPSCAEVCCCLFTPGTPSHQVQAAFWEPRLPVVTEPGLTTSLSQRRPVNPPAITVCNTDSPLCYVALPPPQQQGSSLCVWWGRRWLGKFCACVAPSPVSTWGRAHLISISTEIRKRLKRNRPLLRWLWSGGISRWTDSSSPNLLLLNPSSQAGPKAQVHLCLFSSFLLKRESSAATAQATEWEGTATDRS